VGLTVCSNVSDACVRYDRVARHRERFQRQEGNDAGDGERLHEGSKALKGEPQERIRHEIRPADSERMKVSRG
jgi:hypothetical protein